MLDYGGIRNTFGSGRRSALTEGSPTYSDSRGWYLAEGERPTYDQQTKYFDAFISEILTEIPSPWNASNAWFVRSLPSMYPSPLDVDNYSTRQSETIWYRCWNPYGLHLVRSSAYPSQVWMHPKCCGDRTQGHLNQVDGWSPRIIIKEDGLPKSINFWCWSQAMSEERPRRSGGEGMLKLPDVNSGSLVWLSLISTRPCFRF